MKNILFITESYTTAIRLIPVYLKAVEHPEVNPVMFSTNPAAGALKDLFDEHQVQGRSIQDLLSPDEMEAIKARQTEYAGIWTAETAQYEDGDLNYMGVPLFKKYGGYLLNWNLQKIAFMTIFDKVAERLNPDVLIVGYDSGGTKKYYVNRAGELGIKTVHVQYSYYPEHLQFDRKWINSDYYCLWGQAHLEPFLPRKKMRANAVITGATAFDLYIHDRREVRRELGYHPEDRLFLVGIGQVFQLEKFMREIGQFKARPGDRFIIKLHPDYHHLTDEFRTGLQNLPIDYQLVGAEISPYKLLSAVDYSIAFHQDTLWLESFYYRVPPILVNLHSAPPVFAFKILEDVGLVIRDLGELNQLDEMQSRILKQDMERVRELLFYNSDHQASQRVLELILSLNKNGAAAAART